MAISTTSRPSSDKTDRPPACRHRTPRSGGDKASNWKPRNHIRRGNSLWKTAPSSSRPQDLAHTVKQDGAVKRKARSPQEEKCFADRRARRVMRETFRKCLPPPEHAQPRGCDSGSTACQGIEDRVGPGSDEYQFRRPACLFDRSSRQGCVLSRNWMRQSRDHPAQGKCTTWHGMASVLGLGTGEASKCCGGFTDTLQREGASDGRADDRQV